MKKLLLALFLVSAVSFSQEKQPKFEKQGGLVKATYYYDNGNIKVQGFFKNKKLTGIWTSFDQAGNKTQIGQYNNGKKVGKWFVWNNDNLKEITYKNSVIIGVNDWKSESKLAINND